MKAEYDYHEKEKNTGKLSDDIYEQGNIANNEFLEKKISSEISGRYRWRRKLFLLLIWGTIVFAGLLSFPFLKTLPVDPMKLSKSQEISPKIRLGKQFPVQSDRSVTFDSFIIPFEEQGKFTYISLSLSFELPNKELREEMYKKNTLIRGVIYMILCKNIKILTTVSSLERLKGLITCGVNGVLAPGKVNDITITDFSAV